MTEADTEAARKQLAAYFWWALKLEQPGEPPSLASDDATAAELAAAAEQQQQRANWERNWGVVLALHSSYVDRYHRDNDRSWTTATWLVAVAWALFPAAIALKSTHLTTEIVVGFGLTSMALIVLWLCIATWHLKWASRSYDIVRALEIALLDGGRPQPEAPSEWTVSDDGDSGKIIRDKVIALHPKPKCKLLHLPLPSMPVLRWFILGGTALAWGVLGVVVDGARVTF